MAIRNDTDPANAYTGLMDGTSEPTGIQFLQQNFYLLQIGIGAIFAGAAWIFFRPKTPESGFKNRESDRKLKFSKAGAKTLPGVDLASATLRPEPLRLGGIRLDGLPHEILGIKASASEDEVQKIWRDLMKQYHPDKVGRPDSREWRDAQKIAEAINLAKEKMLLQVKKAKSRT